MDAVIYARASSGDDSQSYDRQIDDLNRFALYKKLKVTKIYAEKISTHKKEIGEREQFAKMIEHIEKKIISNIFW